MLEIYVFSLGAGQCIFVRPSENNNEYCMMIDCAESEYCKPVEYILNNNLLPKGNEEKPILKNLTLTNYDEDHFSGIERLKQKVNIQSICFSKNLSSEDIKRSKEQSTPALKAILDLKDSYTTNMTDWNPPFKKETFALQKDDLENKGYRWDTNNLSQLVFIKYKGFVMCIPGDLEEIGWDCILTKGWDCILSKDGVCSGLQDTNIFIASHHGRENGYNKKVFDSCHPECIIISDKQLEYDTQDGMPDVYAQHVQGNGINFNGCNRKVLTTRRDGNILIKIDDAGHVEYNKFYC